MYEVCFVAQLFLLHEWTLDGVTNDVEVSVSCAGSLINEYMY